MQLKKSAECGFYAHPTLAATEHIYWNNIQVLF